MVLAGQVVDGDEKPLDARIGIAAADRLALPPLAMKPSSYIFARCLTGRTGIRRPLR